MKAALAGMVLGCLLLAGCASAPVYRPATTPNDYGYRDNALTDSHFRVSFAGGYGVARETVENLALFRAAQVTLAHGSQRFQVVSSQTSSVTGYSGPATSLGYGFGYPYWGSGITIVHSYPYTRYESMLVIDIGPDVPKQGPHVYDARKLKQNLAGLANSARN